MMIFINITINLLGMIVLSKYLLLLHFRFDLYINNFIIVPTNKTVTNFIVVVIVVIHTMTIAITVTMAIMIRTNLL